MSTPTDDDLVKLLNGRHGVATLVRLRDGCVLRLVNIAWGYDDGDRYAHVSTNVSPSVDGMDFDFFHTYEIEAIADPESGDVLYDSSMDAAAASQWLLGLGYEVEVSTEGRHEWVSLRSIRDRKFVVPKYGRGPSSESAILSAARRWRIEQIDMPPAGARRLP